ncbi:MAG TPA: hypothetical protein VFJ75_07315 [Gaiellaceae bacterium]|nr:hypothetical protein [Gaiellaceae bacterium]
MLGGVALVLLPWSAFLSATLPSRHVAEHWELAWTGFDLFEAAAIIGTFVAVLRRSPAVTVLATIAGTALLCDAWFDLVTASPGRDVQWALLFAVFAELPLAALCFWIAVDSDRALASAARASEAVPPPTASPARRVEGRQRART